MNHLGVHVYRWSSADQRDLIRDGLRMVALETREEGLCDRYWYTIFDARGPHVFAIFSIGENGGQASGADRMRNLSARVGSRLEAWLGDNPSNESLDSDGLSKRHQACRGKVLSAIDRQEDFADNDSVVLFGHPPDGYPFRWTREMKRETEVWSALDAVSFWAMDHAAETICAVRLVSSVDRALANSDLSAESFWRYFAATLVPPLKEGLNQGDFNPRQILPKLIGAKNLSDFDRAWETGPHADNPPVERAVHLAAECDGRSAERRVALLREIVHSSLSQLLQGVQFRIPLILYAWYRNA